MRNIQQVHIDRAIAKIKALDEELRTILNPSQASGAPPSTKEIEAMRDLEIPDILKAAGVSLEGVLAHYRVKG